MTENDINPPINNDPMEKRNGFIDHPSYKLDQQVEEALIYTNVSKSSYK